MEQSVQSLAQEVEKQAQEILNLQLMLLMAQSRQQQQQIPAVDPGVRFVPMGPAEGTGGMSGPPGILRWSEAARPQAWDITFDGAEATCSECVYMRGPVTLALSVSPLNLTLDDAYIAAHINLEYGTAILVEGASIAAVTDVAPLDDDTLVKVLLYT